MGPSYNALRMSELRALAKDCSLRCYSKLRKADPISLPRFDPEESDSEVGSPSDDPKMLEEGAQKQLDSEDKVNSPSCDQMIAEEGTQFDPEESENEE